MLESLSWVALEVKYLDRARSVYVEDLDLPVLASRETALHLGVGDASLILRTPSQVPRGGLHVHLAFSTPPADYDAWWTALADRYPLEEHVFGESRSLYFHDEDDHCVEIGQRDLGRSDAVDGALGDGDRRPPLTGIFEVVLEVESLDRSERFYRSLGFTPVDRGSGRRRVRLTGPMDLELWEPHLGLADARGGVHVDLGFRGRPAAVPEDAMAIALEHETIDGDLRLRDPDGHYVTIHPTEI